jgi:hypothetical protein
MRAKDRIVVVDCEATCFPYVEGSYPIEIGIADVDEGTVRSWLVRPDGAWLADLNWDPAAENVHGISRDRLDAEGLPREQVAREVLEAVDGRLVLSDYPEFEMFWLSRLVGRRFPYGIHNAWKVAEQVAGGGRIGSAAASLALAKAKQRFPVEHRAGDDAMRMAETIRIISGLAP